MPRTSTAEPAAKALPGAQVMVRSALGGVLMGLANLVPGISGGTMLLAVGIYPEFIDAVSKVSTLRLRTYAIALLGAVGTGAVLSILLLAGLLRDLVLEQRWIMYSLFIGLTLGGVPLVLGLMKPARRIAALGAVVGVAGMAALSWAQLTGAGAGTAADGSSQWFLLLIAGLAGASAMILPGISGGYLLLLLGQYVPILGGIDALKDALVARDLTAMMEPILGIVIPVGLGVVLGAVLVSNLMRILLERFPQPTLGVLLGLLLGAVVGLWPFQQAVQPVPGETVIKGQVVTEESLTEIDPADYPIAIFRPTAGQSATALMLICVGLGATTLIARVGRSHPESM